MACNDEEMKMKEEDESTDRPPQDPIFSLDKTYASVYTCNTLKQVPCGVASQVMNEMSKIFAEMGISGTSNAPRPSVPTSKLNDAYELGTKMHAYYRQATADARGCAIYGMGDGRIVFVTDTFEDELDEGSTLMVGEYVGVVTHFFQIWECGKILADGITENPFRRPVPAKFGDTEKYLKDRDPKDRPPPMPDYIKKDRKMEDPYDSGNVYAKIVTKRKRGVIYD